jgi:sporulation protein YlmC with PRC-barrel domain
MTLTHSSGYRIGAATTTTDGKPGTVRALVVDPGTRNLTHLAVDPSHHHHQARLVPVAMASAEPTGEVRLAYSLEAFSRLDELEELDVIDIGSSRLYGVGGGGNSINGIEHVSVWNDCPPEGEAALRLGTPVQVGDDTVGHVDGLIVGRDEHIAAVLVTSGHLWSRRTIAVPVDAVTQVEAGRVTIAGTWDQR